MHDATRTLCDPLVIVVIFDYVPAVKTLCQNNFTTTIAMMHLPLTVQAAAME